MLIDILLTVLCDWELFSPSYSVLLALLIFLLMLTLALTLERWSWYSFEPNVCSLDFLLLFRRAISRGIYSSISLSADSAYVNGVSFSFLLAFLLEDMGIKLMKVEANDDEKDFLRDFFNMACFFYALSSLLFWSSLAYFFSSNPILELIAMFSLVFLSNSVAILKLSFYYW